MPRRYVRKADAKPRANWTEEGLRAAFKDLQEKKCSMAAAARRYGIPSRTLSRRFYRQDATKLTLGKHPLLDFENEERIMSHVTKLEEAGFPVTRHMMRRLAYELAEECSIDHNFDGESRKAGISWLRSFLDRHPELGVRRTEELTIASQGLSREEVDRMSENLIQALMERDLLVKPELCEYRINRRAPTTAAEEDKFTCAISETNVVTIDLSAGDTIWG